MNFKSLKRLLFWHGRRYGTTFMVFLGLFLFKGQFNMTVTLFSNCYNGFSGEQMYRELYYSLFNTFHTPWALLLFLYLDQDVSFISDYYSKKELDKVEISKDYDPNSSDNMDFMDRNAILERKGIAYDKEDGSTRCLAEYYWYCRDTVQQRLYP
jgi:hypothetical protein